MELPVGTLGDVEDELVDRAVIRSEVPFTGAIFDVRSEEVDLGDHGTVTREYVRHPGAVIVVALRDVGGVDHVVLIRQYRHPVHALEWELPAGILDVSEEPPLATAVRELREEVDLQAGRWDLLLDFFSSPGASSEALRVFLARDVDEAAGDLFERTGEEAGITGVWVPLDDAYAAVLRGQVHNAGAVVGIMAAWGARARGWATLRPADSPWPWYARG